MRAQHTRTTALEDSGRGDGPDGGAAAAGVGGEGGGGGGGKGGPEQRRLRLGGGPRRSGAHAMEGVGGRGRLLRLHSRLGALHNLHKHLRSETNHSS